MPDCFVIARTDAGLLKAVCFACMSAALIVWRRQSQVRALCTALAISLGQASVMSVIRLVLVSDPPLILVAELVSAGVVVVCAYSVVRSVWQR